LRVELRVTEEVSDNWVCREGDQKISPRPPPVLQVKGDQVSRGGEIIHPLVFQLRRENKPDQKLTANQSEKEDQYYYQGESTCN